MSDAYHYAKNGQTYGPVSLDKIRDLVASGDLARTDFVIPSGGKEWLTADKVIGSAVVAAALPKPAVAAPRPAAAAGSKAEGGFRYKRDGQELGPVGFDELKRMAADGKLRATDLVSEDGGPWKPAARHRGVFAGRRCEVNEVTFLHPKDWWVTASVADENPEFVTVSVENKFVAFNMNLYPDSVGPEKALRTLRSTIEGNEKYKNVKFGKTTAQFGGERAEGFEYEAGMMSLTFVGRVYAVSLGDRTVTLMFQASDERFESIRPVSELIRGSFAVVG